MIKHKNKFPVIAGVIFVLTAVTAVAAAWISGQHVYDLRLSFSLYVGIFRETSVLYFAAAAVMLTLLGIYIAKTAMPLIKRIVYGGVFVCILGTALFPCNAYSSSPSALTVSLHNRFAVALMLVTAVSFLLSAILAKNKKQRIPAVLSVGYLAVFIVMYFARFQPMFRTFFIWENLAILLLMIVLHTEQYGEGGEKHE